MEPATIAGTTWDACETCRHSDPEQGGCDVPDDQLNDGLTLYLGDWIVCGCYEEATDA